MTAATHRAARAVAGVVVVALLALAQPERASAWCRLTTSRRQPTAAEPCILPDTSAEPPELFLAWRRRCSGIALSVTSPSSDLTESEVVGIFERSLDTWNRVQCGGSPLGVDLTVMNQTSTCDAPLYRDDGGNVNSVQFVVDWGARMYDPNAFALTTVWHRRSTGEILDADMDINERRGPYGICPIDGCIERTVDLENVVTHEMGHYLGLAHTQEAEATMFASAVAGETLKRDLHADDIEGLCAIYPPGEPAGECNFTPRGGLDLDCDTGCGVAAPGSGGRPAPTSAAWLTLLGLAALSLRRRS